MNVLLMNHQKIQFIYFFRKGVQLAHVGQCAPLLKNAPCPSSCDDEEDPSEQPVCGSDGNVYRLKINKYLLIIVLASADVDHI